MSSAEKHLRQVDGVLDQARDQVRVPDYGTNDLVSHVFSSQAATRAANALHATALITERQELTRKQLADIQWRLDELLARRPLRAMGPGAPRDDGKLSDIERQIFDLEKQKHAVQIALWRDLIDLRGGVFAERSEQRAMANRWSYLFGGANGQA